jgi:CRISPR-associated protein (TIGR02584 family)
MGIYLTAAMQLYGRAHNALSHVLVGEDFETNPEFSTRRPARAR